MPSNLLVDTAPFAVVARFGDDKADKVMGYFRSRLFTRGELLIKPEGR